MSDDKLINTVDKTLFDELSDLTDTFVKMIDKVLAEYQKAGIADMRYIDYQLEYYMGAVAVIEACEDQGLKMCRPKILPAGERKAVIKDIFDPVYFREARIYNLDHKEKNLLSQTISPWAEKARAFMCLQAQTMAERPHFSVRSVCVR